MKVATRVLFIAGLIAGIFIATVGCSPSKSSELDQKKPGEESVSLTISAAASLTDAMEEIKQLYREEKPNVTITYNFGSSGSLQQQIEQGAPVDIFLSAAMGKMDPLIEKGLIMEDTHKKLLENKIVLIVPKDASVVTSFKDLTMDKVLRVALGEPSSVPAGKYASEVLTNLNIAEKVQLKAILAKNVREVLTWVETGNVDAGIVYETDAQASDKVKIVATAPEGSHTPVIYPAAVIKDSKNGEEAKRFMEFLSSDKAKFAFEKLGFHVLKD